MSQFGTVHRLPPEQGPMHQRDQRPPSLPPPWGEPVGDWLWRQATLLLAGFGGYVAGLALERGDVCGWHLLALMALVGVEMYASVVNSIHR
jgi:hypothetical protein